MDEFGTEMFEWDPITLSLEIRDTYGFEPSMDLQDKVQAVSALLTSNLFFLSLEAFSTVCDAFNFGAVTSEIFVPADLDDVLWGVTEAKILLGEDYTPDGFSHNIARFVGVLLSQEGISDPPKMLAFAEYDETQASRIHDISTSDPVMYKAYFDDQQSYVNELDLVNKNKLVALLDQLSNLPLKNGSTGFAQQALENMRSDMAPTVPAP